MSYPSETAKYRHLTTKYCDGAGIDIGSQGDPVVPWAWQMELWPEEYAHYNSDHKLPRPVQLRGHMDKLPVDDGSLDFIYCSHVLEDASREQWVTVMTEWMRALKPGGYMIILVPEVERWNYAIRELGQCPNCSHCAPEPSVGDLSKVATKLGLSVIEERLTDCFEHDYSILGVFQKPIAELVNPS